jgi:chromosome segregation ATPase
MEIIEKDLTNLKSHDDEISLNRQSYARPSQRTPGRELNPSLFAETSSRAKVIEGGAHLQVPQVMHADQKIHELKAQISVLAEHLGKVSQGHTELAKSSQHKFEKIQQVLIKLENNDQYIVNEAAQKFARMNDRFAERKSVDAKVQEMIDRHNSILKSFEMRLAQMQRILMEKESQLLTTQAALNETKMEIARLKRL